jgi:Tfp pilus assembly ATPase PilU
MQLLDEHLFKLWKDGIVTKEDAIAKANLPDGLAERRVRHEKGLATDEGAEDEESDDDDMDNGPKQKRNPKIKYT